MTTSIAVIIPCFNNEQWVEQAIASVLSQNHPRLEIIVVDDGSTDNSINIVRSFGDRVRLIVGEHRGACAARNLGLAHATAEFVLFLDADDYLHGPYLPRLADRATHDVDLVVGAIALGDTSGSIFAPRTYKRVEGSLALIATYINNPLQTSAFLWRREFAVEGGGWNETFLRLQDQEIAVRLLLKQPRFRQTKVEDGFVVYRQHTSPHRITNKTTRELWHKDYTWLQSLKPVMQRLDSPLIQDALAMRFFTFAESCFAHSIDDLGTAALLEARQFGLRSYPGSISRRTLRLFLGVKGASRFVRAFRSRWPVRGDRVHVPQHSPLVSVR